MTRIEDLASLKSIKRRIIEERPIQTRKCRRPTFWRFASCIERLTNRRPRSAPDSG